MVSGSLALSNFLGESRAVPPRGIKILCSSICPFVRSSVPPQDHSARPKTQPAGPDCQPATSKLGLSLDDPEGGMTVWMYGETDNRWTLSPIEAAIQKGTSWVVKPFAILILFSEVAKALNLK